jgi:polyisoprenoid-binding protein YceI
MKTTKSLFTIVAVLFAATTFAQDFTTDLEKTTIIWEGKKVGGAHYGNIMLKEGNFTLKNNQITAGTFVIDMNSITNNDIESNEWRVKLIKHLKSDDFFGVATYPTAKLTVTKSSVFKANKATVNGELSIKGKNHPIEFEVTRKGNSYTALITVDRSKYDVRYGSKSFFDNLGDKVIDDEFTLNINLVVN